MVELSCFPCEASALGGVSASLHFSLTRVSTLYLIVAILDKRVSIIMSSISIRPMPGGPGRRVLAFDVTRGNGVFRVRHGRLRRMDSRRQHSRAGWIDPTSVAPFPWFLGSRGNCAANEYHQYRFTDNPNSPFVATRGVTVLRICYPGLFIKAVA